DKFRSRNEAAQFEGDSCCSCCLSALLGDLRGGTVARIQALLTIWKNRVQSELAESSKILETPDFWSTSFPSVVDSILNLGSSSCNLSPVCRLSMAPCSFSAVRLALHSPKSPEGMSTTSE
ncbi:hypothetical protein PENTCL1PPCAC_2958, partial [Pristionchus entomophagus]